MSYAQKHGPFPEGEDIIVLEGYYVVNYAKEVLHGRFPRFEQNIQTFLNTKPTPTNDLFYICYHAAPYITEVLQHQWPLIKGTPIETYLKQQNWGAAAAGLVVNGKPALPPAPPNWKEFPYEGLPLLIKEL